ncbi:MAG: NAD-dependent epimerase/dehydratase family protein [Flavobacteriales bacterium TMED96]|nr:MAG: NAD-dependent epimerase/dehydratase family protein [Flavobacteriales bacterium TMED96]|tara:strand:+ start:5496 stop:6407 length:912 start_codon:yes stop_codon:yes gene_type:complete
MKYVVVGGAGFIGSNLVDKLIENKNEVTIIDNFTTGKKSNLNPKASVLELDVSNISNYDKIVHSMRGADTVFMLAAKARVQPSIENPLEYEINNTIGTLNILKCASDAKVRRFVYSASSSAYGDSKKLPLKENFDANPMSPYGAQKFYGEVMCKVFAKVYQIQTVSLRYFNVYGERQNIDGAYALVMGIFIYQRLNNQPMTINGDGEQRRDFTYVGDVVSANILASSSENVGNGEVINIGNGDNRSVNQIAEMIGGPKINLDPILEPNETLADNSLAKKLLNWEPTQKIEDWVKKYKKEIGLD